MVVGQLHATVALSFDQNSVMPANDISLVISNMISLVISNFFDDGLMLIIIAYLLIVCGHVGIVASLS